MRIWTEASFPATSPPWWLILSLPHPLSSWHTPGSGTCFKVNTRKGPAVGNHAGHPSTIWAWGWGSGALHTRTSRAGRRPAQRGCLGSEPSGSPSLCSPEQAVEGPWLWLRLPKGGLSKRSGGEGAQLTLGTAPNSLRVLSHAEAHSILAISPGTVAVNPIPQTGSRGSERGPRLHHDVIGSGSSTSPSAAE